MSAKPDHSGAVVKTFVVNRSPGRSKHFLALAPELVTSEATLRRSLTHGTSKSLWICYDRKLTDLLLKSHRSSRNRLGRGLLLHPVSLESLPSLISCFTKVAFSVNDGFLPPGELGEVLASEQRFDLFIGGSVDFENRTVTLWRGDLESLTIPLSAFESSPDGTTPDFNRFSVTDSGHTVRLGEYEAATDALLYEFDPKYRSQRKKSRLAAERTIGASLRRLRLQRGLTRQDFEPEIAAKTVARIEQGQVKRVHARTLEILARRLHVAVDQIETY